MDATAYREDRLGRAHDPLARRRLRGILYREWLAHRSRILVLVTVWLVGLWILLVFHHPGFLVGFGIVYALVAAPALAGLDASEGSEEFSFALPPTRGELYRVRLLAGAGLLAAMLGIGLLGIRYDLPQKVWGMLVESGFTVPFGAEVDATWVAFVLVVPLSLFAVTFMAAAACTSRGAVGSAWLMGVLLTGILAGGAQIAEKLLLGSTTGRLALVVVAVGGAAAAVLGHRVFSWKEGVARPDVHGRASSSTAWVLAIFAIILLLAFLAFVLTGVPTPM